jgi:imidazolonepropionase-like amidohydrolase
VGQAVVPGLIDCHSHVAYDRLRGLDESIELTQSYRVLASVANLQKTGPQRWMNLIAARV